MGRTLRKRQYLLWLCRRQIDERQEAVRDAGEENTTKTPHDAVRPMKSWLLLAVCEGRVGALPRVR